ncbi:hypothetical protein K9L97_01125 [Candidatus Woesearchaeota archaeon]|nr:hypothetical protein [Candidatus Woesearchaeota archaeon]
MVTNFVTYFESDKSLEGRLNSLVDIAVWDYDEKTEKFSENDWYKIKIPNKISTPFLKNQNRKELLTAVNSFREKIEDKYVQEISNIQKSLEKKMPKKQKDAKQEKMFLIERFLENINEEIKLLGPFGNGNYESYNVIMPPIEKMMAKTYLSKYFQFFNSTNYTLQIMMELNFPFNIVEFHDGKIKFTKKRMEIDTLLKAPIYYLDYEATDYKKYSMTEKLTGMNRDELENTFIKFAKVYNYKLVHNDFSSMNRKDFIQGINSILDSKRNERLTGAVFGSLDTGEQKLITSIKSGKDKIIIDNPWNEEKHEFEIITVKDQFEQTKYLNKNFKGLFIAGFYHLFYDYLAGEKFTGIQNFGMRGKKAKFKGQIIDYRQTRMLPGRIDVDPSSCSQKIMKNPSNKMDAVGEDVSGIKTKKKHNHEELEIITHRALNGDLKAAIEFLKYTAIDGLKTGKIVRDLLPEHLHLFRIFNSIGYRIDATGINSLTEEFWYMNHFKRNKAYPFESIKSFKAPIFEEEIKYKDYKIQNLTADYFKFQNHKIETKKGLKNAYLVDFFPLTSSFKSLLRKDKDVENFYKFASTSKDEKLKARAYRWIEQLAKYPYFYSQKHKEAWKFNKHFGIHRNEKEIEEINTELMSYFNKVQALFEDCPPINYNGESILLSENISEEELKERMKPLGIIKGKGPFISGTKGRFAGNINGQLIMQGIADFNSKKGERNIFEKDIYNKFFETILFENNLEEALKYVFNRIEQFHKGNLTKEELIYEKIAKKDHTDYAISATAPFIDAFIERQVMKGDEVRYEYNYERLLKKFFGMEEVEFSNKTQSSLSIENTPQKICDYNSSCECKHYKFHPEQGTISRIINWVFPVHENTLEKNVVASAYLNGESNELVKKIICSHKN